MASKRRQALWTQRALRDLQIITAYYEAERESGALRKLMRQFKAAARLIVERPEASPIATDVEPQGRYRHHVVYPYRMIFRFDAKQVYVVRVWDARREPQALTVEG